MIKILVTGSQGQLGNAIQYISQQYTHWDFSFFNREMLDFNSDKELTLLRKRNFDYLINCAAYTAVDKAESEEEEAFYLNSEVPQVMAGICKSKNAGFIHISSDYVFNGENYKPYQEEDPTDPASVYGRSKLQGEQGISTIYKDACIIRSSWIYSKSGSNFLNTMLRLGTEKESINVVCDQIGSPTYAPDLARAICRIIEIGYKGGIYHYSNNGVASWFDFAKQIMELASLNCVVNPVNSTEYPTAAKRPHYSVLDKNKIQETFKLDIPYWRDSLKKCFLDN